MEGPVFEEPGSSPVRKNTKNGQSEKIKGY
jgi:hypothetical protein